MIKCNKGAVLVSGGAAQVLSELSVIIAAVHKNLADIIGKEAADEMIVRAGRAAFMEPDEILKEINRIEMLLKEGTK